MAGPCRSVFVTDVIAPGPALGTICDRIPREHSPFNLVSPAISAITILLVFSYNILHYSLVRCELLGIGVRDAGKNERHVCASGETVRPPSDFALAEQTMKSDSPLSRLGWNGCAVRLAPWRRCSSSCNVGSLCDGIATPRRGFIGAGELSIRVQWPSAA